MGVLRYLLSDSHYEIFLHVNLYVPYITSDTSISVWSSYLVSVRFHVLFFSFVLQTDKNRKKKDRLQRSPEFNAVS